MTLICGNELIGINQAIKLLLLIILLAIIWTGVGSCLKRKKPSDKYLKIIPRRKT
jgi:hypothetical protein